MYSPPEPPKQAEPDAPELEQAERGEFEAWQEAKLEREAAAFEAALPELKLWWQEQRAERWADADAKAWQRERDERLIAEWEAAEARESARARWRFRWRWRQICAFLRRDDAAREANHRTVATPPTRRRGAGCPAGRRTATTSTGSDSDSSDPEPQPPLPGMNEHAGDNGWRYWITDEPGSDRRCYCGWLGGREHYGTGGDGRIVGRP